VAWDSEQFAQRPLLSSGGHQHILTINTQLTLTKHCKDQVKIHKLKNSYFNHVWWHLTILASTGVAMVMLVIYDLTSSQQ
jgi:hypothetical protein